MKVTAAVFRTHMSEYLQKLKEDDIYITRHGKMVGVLISPSRWETKNSDKAAIETYMRLSQEHRAEMVKLLQEKSGG